MAVYRRSYTSYAGLLTPAWSRSLVLFRYSRKKLFRSKLQTALFVLCFFYPLLCLILIYLAHNLSFLERLEANQSISIDNRFFFFFINVQVVLAFVLTAFTGPGLISPDIFARNEACRCERKIVSVAGSCPATLLFVDASFMTGSLVGVSGNQQIPTHPPKKVFGVRKGRPRRPEPASPACPPAG